MYNSHAVVMKLSRRTSTQLENKLKILRDGYKEINDSLKTTGSGFDRDSMSKDFPFWDTFDRLYRDRDSFNPNHILDLQQAKSKKANTDQSYTEAQDQFDSSDEVSEDDTLALAAKRRSDWQIRNR